MENVIVDQPVDIIGQEAHIQNRIDVVTAGVAIVDGIVFRVSVAIE